METEKDRWKFLFRQLGSHVFQVAVLFQEESALTWGFELRSVITNKVVTPENHRAQFPVFKPTE